MHAVWWLFVVGLEAATVACVVFSGRIPLPGALRGVPPISLAGGLIVGFYVVSVTLLVPRFGVGATILFAVSAQVVASALIDHFGLMGTPVREVGGQRALGIALLILGLALAQLAPSATEPAAAGSQSAAG